MALGVAVFQSTGSMGLWKLLACFYDCLSTHMSCHYAREFCYRKVAASLRPCLPAPLAKPAEIWPSVWVALFKSPVSASHWGTQFTSINLAARDSWRYRVRIDAKYQSTYDRWIPTLTVSQDRLEIGFLGCALKADVTGNLCPGAMCGHLGCTPQNGTPWVVDSSQRL